MSLQGKTTTIVNLEEKMRWILRQAWPFHHHCILREARNAEQSKVSICVYKAYICILFF